MAKMLHESNSGLSWTLLHFVFNILFFMIDPIYVP